MSHDGSTAGCEPHSERVAIVTCDAGRTGSEIAAALAKWDWAIVLVYLDDQTAVEAVVAEILAADGRIVAVRADLADELDVERLFAEATAMFGAVEVVVHSTDKSPVLLYRHASRHLRRGGVIVTVLAGDDCPPDITERLDEQGVSIRCAPHEGVLAFLRRWQQPALE